jgi:hypothetical protein
MFIVGAFAYGHTSEFEINPYRIDLIARVSDNHRRLALQYGNEIQLYSFGEYLATDPVRPRQTSDRGVTISSFPQPAHNSIQFKFSGALNHNTHLMIFNLLGQEVGRTPIVNHQTVADINLTALPAGIYFASLQNQPQIKPHKFFVMK